MPDIVLHHCPRSPYAEKIRLALGLKGLSYHSIIVPGWMPKPDLVPLTGGYRRTPVMQVGADVFCDTLAILRKIERMRPAPSLYDAGLRLRPHAGTYSAVLQYLNGIKDAKTDDGPTVAARMRAIPLTDALFDGATIREDGRVMLDQYLMRVKSPKESQGPHDLAAILTTIPAAQAYRPMSEGGCPYVLGKKA